ncbi:MAG: hypothetical protein JWP57_2770 [Spirosoma sp.]|nr:hypothetical protein [Spirosoma sp.]
MRIPDKHLPHACPRCGRLFTCRANSGLKCDCMGFTLSPATLQRIREYTELTFGDYTCLYVACLQELQQESE